MEGPSITIEIFRDTATPRVDTEPLRDAIEIVSQFAPLTLVGPFFTERLFLASGSEESIMCPSLDKFSFTADLNLIATARKIEWSEPAPVLPGAAVGKAAEIRSVLGYATKDARRIGGLAAACVSVGDSDYPEFAAVHEIGHMMNLRIPNNQSEVLGHCIRPDCFMFRAIGKYVVDMHRPLKKLRKHKEVSLEWAVHPNAETFCADCAQELSNYAFCLRQSKRG